MTNYLFDENMNVDIELLADLWEEEQAVLKEAASLNASEPA